MVGAQLEQVLGVGARAAVGVDVAAAEAVNGLLGVADHHQAAALVAGGVAVEAVEDAVLLGVGVLEFVHQGDRPGLEQRIGQRRAGEDGRMRAPDHFVERDLAARGQAFVAPAPGLFDLLLPEAAERHETRGFDARPVREQRDDGRVRQERRLVFGADLLFERALAHQGEMLVLRPGAGAREQRGQRRERRAQRGVGACEPRGPRHDVLQPGGEVFRQAGQHGGQVFAVGVYVHAGRHELPQLPSEGGQLQRVEVEALGHVASALVQHAPGVARELFRQRQAGRGLAHFEAASALERMLDQDALAQAVQRAHGRAVEIGERQAQAAPVFGAGLRIRPAINQPGLIFARVFGGRPAGTGGVGQRQRIAQRVAQAFAQLLRRGVGEGGDHQLLDREGFRRLQQQAQVKHGDGPGLAGAGAGFHQRTAGRAQRQLRPVADEHGCGHAAPSPPGVISRIRSSDTRLRRSKSGVSSSKSRPRPSRRA